MKSRSKFFAGKCLCTAITVRLPEKVTDVGVCHCAMCRRWNSGPWMSFQVPEAEITGKPLAVYRSSAFAERGFCARCGSHIFHRPQDGPELAISAGQYGTRVASEIAQAEGCAVAFRFLADAWLWFFPIGLGSFTARNLSYHRDIGQT